ncbi:MAG: mycofactocin biosynthesis peptidyl-dipeptidase MftE [Actinomycetota bacterium]
MAPRPPRHELLTRTWPQAAEGPDVLLVPLGSTEQHGPHLPLGTDTLIAAAWCRRVAERRTDVVVGAPLPYGSSGEHQAFTGTISIGTDALTAVLVEICRSALPPFARLVFVNGHGGNAVALDRAVALLRSEGRMVESISPRLSGDAHAGRTETSLLLAEAPHLVGPAPWPAGNPAPMAELLPLLMRDGVRPHSENGVLGDAGGASPDEGRRLWDQLVDQLDAVLDRALPAGP